MEDVYWAKATPESRPIVTPTYNYYYLVPFCQNLIMAHFVTVYDISLIANQLGIPVCFAIYLLSIFYLTSTVFKGWNDRLYFITIATLFASTLAGDSLLHHILSYRIDFVCFVGKIYLGTISSENYLNCYFDYVLNTPVNFVSGYIRDEYATRQGVKNTPAFPLESSIKMIDGELVVKVNPVFQ